MESAFDPNAATWKLSWPARITQHDLVYLSPPHDPMQGIPLGSGDVGALVWCEPNRIVISLNKSDLWDDAPFGQFRNWISAEEDKSTALRHAGRLTIDFGAPLMDPFYLKEFEARLDLAAAQARIYSRTPFGEVRFSAYLSPVEHTLAINCETRLAEKFRHEVILERWGSRTFSHWYAKVRRDPTIGLAGTDAFAKTNELLLTHRLTSGKFAVGCRILPLSRLKLKSERIHSRCATCEISSNSPQKAWSLLLAVTSPLEKERSAQVVKKTLDTAVRKGEKKLFAEHRNYWKKFWNRSYLHIGDDYLENLWYLTMYYAGSSQRGAWPASFVNGLWGWNRDVHQWNYYFHWNQQMIYWPLSAAGHAELLLSYLNFRFNSLPQAVRDARDWFGTDGAFISDVSERRGNNDIHTKDNHTPVAQIAMEFWRYYKFTGDKTFLRTRGLPFMTQAAAFFETLFEKRSDGRYHAKCGTAYENHNLLEDSITELTMAKALLGSVIEAAEVLDIALDERLMRWKEIGEHLASYITMTAPETVISEVGGSLILKVGPFMGSVVPSREFVAGGRRLSDGKLLTSKRYSPETDPTDLARAAEVMARKSIWNTLVPLVQTPLGIRYQYPIMTPPGEDRLFPCAEFCPVFPAGICGLGEKDTPLFNALVSTAKAFSPEWNGCDITPIVLARLGLAEEAMARLMERPDTWQLYPNGCWRAPIEETTKAEGLFYFGTYKVADASLPESDGDMPDEQRFEISRWPFRYMECELMGVHATTINEMLLQSYDGLIRVSPAYKWDAEFSLHAEGGFVVSSEVKGGQVLWVAVESKLGQHCRIENPWVAGEVYVFSNGSITSSGGSRTITFDTEKGAKYILCPDRRLLRKWHVRRRTFKKNMAPKKSKRGIATLGLPRMF